MRDGIIIACFIVVMTLNVVALVRHYIALRWLNITLAAFAEQNRQFVEVWEAERARRRGEQRPGADGGGTAAAGD